MTATQQQSTLHPISLAEDANGNPILVLNVKRIDDYGTRIFGVAFAVTAELIQWVESIEAVISSMGLTQVIATPKGFPSTWLAMSDDPDWENDDEYRERSDDVSYKNVRFTISGKGELMHIVADSAKGPIAILESDLFDLELLKTVLARFKGEDPVSESTTLQFLEAEKDCEVYYSGESAENVESVKQFAQDGFYAVQA